MLSQKFLVCRHCGNIVAYVKESGVPIVCCGEEMSELKPGTTDASLEKHVPVIAVDGNNVTVTVGSIAHPMLAEHYIEWISLQTTQGNQRKELKPGSEPKAVFALADGDSVVAAYEYCNLHKLWKKEI
jgi:desulfoferrodoxin ferrous iron-binding domain